MFEFELLVTSVGDKLQAMCGRIWERADEKFHIIKDLTFVISKIATVSHTAFKIKTVNKEIDVKY